MAALIGRDDIESLRRELADITRYSNSSFRGFASSFGSTTEARSFRKLDDEDELQWAAIERLPTFERLKTSLFNQKYGGKDGERGNIVTDVTKLGALERHLFIDNLLKKIEEDNHRLLQKQKQRIDRAGLELPTVEVRYQKLCIEAEGEVVRGKPIPTLWNTFLSIFTVFADTIGHNPKTNKVKILQDVQGIIKPSRLTLLLGPPGCGKTTLLLALAGKLDQNLKVTGEISYNGYTLNEFFPQKTTAYVSQYDQHIPEMTVRETLDFAARCQGIGSRADIMKEVIRREKQAGIIPEPDIDTYMKAIAIEGLKRSLNTDYILKILGLDTCANTVVGDAMQRGISGGQKKRLTTGEMIVGPAKVLLMDEISNGLDTSTTFQIVTCLQHLTHITGSTILVSLLQPAPETFDLFDDIILMAEGKTVYHGPRDSVLESFEKCGFRCPPRKGIADFLQEVVSKKDQAQYWHQKDQAYIYFSVEEFMNAFKKSDCGQKLDKELFQPFDKTEFDTSALSFQTFSLRKWELLKACMEREWVLMKRNQFVHVFKSAQLVIIGIMTMTVFVRTKANTDVIHANYYMGSLFYAILRLMSNGVAEVSTTVSRLGVFYKQRDFNFYPAWTYSVPAAILKIPFSFLDAFLWTSLTYYVIGYSPEPERFFRQLFLLFVLHCVSISTFRFIASVVRNPSVAVCCSLYILLLMSLFGGFIIPRSSLPAWLGWGFWISPLTYAEIGLSVNEFLAPRWQKVSFSYTTVGKQVLTNRGLNFDGYFYWISLGVLVGFWIIFNIGTTCALTYLKPPRRSPTMISHKNSLDHLERNNVKKISEEDTLHHVAFHETCVEGNHAGTESLKDAGSVGLVLTFQPMTITFENVQYFVDSSKHLRKQGLEQKRLQLLQDITGSFRPGVLTALMGVSGAGKTTLLDVLSGRKTGGYIKGDIKIGGYPKVQESYARISGYCEQSDIHSPQITVKESLSYSAWLRLPPQVDQSTKSEFVADVLQMIELDNIKDALVGLPGLNGLSNEQRKRLTIAVELVSNPSIIFMDEPTSGLDARAAAIVMRVVKNIVNTKRTVVCTIHQPSIDIFETFDELILMKRGGQIIYSGELGRYSTQLIEYFEDIPGVPKIQENYNPATWMLEVTSASAEAHLQLDFANLYKESQLCQKTKELVRELNFPAQASHAPHFSQNGWEQFKACLWKQNLSYWRSPKYNLVRIVFMIAASLLLGSILWQKGTKINGEQDLFNVLGSMFIFLQLLGIGNCSSVIPFIATERTITYRERFAGMYSSWAYSFAQVIVEIPYIFLQTVLFVIITYPTVGFYWSLEKVSWYFYTMFCTMMYYTYLGMLLISISPTFQVASVTASLFYTTMTLFSGFLIPGPQIPKWWVWFYWMCPTAWSLKGLLISQYGDIDKKIQVFGEHKAINTFLGSYFGYHQHDLGVVALVLIAFPLAFVVVFAYAIAKLNFQKR